MAPMVRARRPCSEFVAVGDYRCTLTISEATYKRLMPIRMPSLSAGVDLARHQHIYARQR